MLELVDLPVSHAHVNDIHSLLLITAIASAEGHIILVLDISNESQNTILPNPGESVYHSLPYLYPDWYKRKSPKHLLTSINPKELCIKEIYSIQVTKPAGKFW